MGERRLNLDTMKSRPPRCVTQSVPQRHTCQSATFLICSSAVRRQGLLRYIPWIIKSFAFGLVDARPAPAVVWSGFHEFYFQRYLPIPSHHTMHRLTQNTTEKDIHSFCNTISMIVSQRVYSFSLRADTMKNKSSAMWYLAECYVNIITKNLIYRD